MGIRVICHPTWHTQVLAFRKVRMTTTESLTYSFGTLSSGEEESRHAEIKLKGEITTTGWPGCSTNLGQSAATVRDWDCAAGAGLKDKRGFEIFGLLDSR